MDADTIGTCKALLVGKQCTEAEGPDPYLSLLIGTARLIVWSEWRLVSEEAVITSSTADEAKNDLKKVLQGIVTAVEIEQPFSDFRITFENGLTLESFQDSQTYENWNLIDGPNMVIAGPGCLWSLFLQP